MPAAAPPAAAATLKFSTLPGVHLLPLQVLNFAAGNSSSSSSSWWVFFWVWLKGRPTDDILLSANKAKTKKACCCCCCNYCNTTTTTTTVVLLTCSYKQANACDAIAAPTILAAQQNPFFCFSFRFWQFCDEAPSSGGVHPKYIQPNLAIPKIYEQQKTMDTFYVFIFQAIVAIFFVFWRFFFEKQLTYDEIFPFF